MEEKRIAQIDEYHRTVLCTRWECPDCKHMNYPGESEEFSTGDVRKCGNCGAEFVLNNPEDVWDDSDMWDDCAEEGEPTNEEDDGH